MVELARWGSGYLNDLAWTSDGKYLLVGTSLGIHLLDSGTYTEVGLIETGESVIELTVSPYARLVATRSESERVSVWELATGRLVKQLAADADAESDRMMFSPDGAFFVTTSVLLQPSGDGGITRELAVVVWRTGDYQKVLTHKVPGCTDDYFDDGFTHLAFSPDSRLLAISDCQLTVLETHTWQELAAPDLDDFSKGHIAFDQENHLFYFSDNEAIKAVDLETGKSAWVFRTHENRFIISPDRNSLAVIPAMYLLPINPVISLVDVASRKQILFIETSNNSIDPVFSPDSRFLAVFSNQEIQIWDLQTKALQHTIRWDALSPAELLFAPYRGDGQPARQQLYAVSWLGVLRIFDPERHTLVQKYELLPENYEINSLVVHPGGNLLAFGYRNDDNSDVGIGLFEMSRAYLASISPAIEGSSVVAFSQDGEALAVLDSERESPYIGAYRFLTGEELANPGEKTWFNPGEKTWHDPGEARINSTGQFIGISYTWGNVFDTPLTFSLQNLSTGQIILAGDVDQAGDPCWGIDGGGYRMDLSADQRYAALYCNLAVTIWDTKTQQIHLSLPSQRYGEIWDLQFSPRGHLFAITRPGGILELWDARSGRRLKVINATSGGYILTFSPDGQYLATAGGGVVRLWGLAP